MKEHMAYFITDEDSTKGKDPNINIINGIDNIKGKTCLEPAITDDMTSDQPNAHFTNNVTLQKMMAEQVQLDTFNPLCHKLRSSIESKLNILLEEYVSQFAKDETSIGMTLLTEMTIDIGTANPVSQKPYPIGMKNYQWVKEEIEKLLMVKVICSTRSSWSASIIVVPKGEGGK